MFVCMFCYGEIDDKSNNNYDEDHTEIRCPHCGKWNKVEILEDAFYDPFQNEVVK